MTQAIVYGRSEHRYVCFDDGWMDGGWKQRRNLIGQLTFYNPLVKFVYYICVYVIKCVERET